MPSPTTVRGLLGHLPRGADLPAVNKRSSPPPVLLPTYLSLRVISAARVGGGGARGGAGGRKSLRDGKSEVRGAGGRSRDGRGTKRSTIGAERGTTEATETTATATRGRRRMTEDPPVSMQDNGEKGKYHVGSKGTEESA